MAYQLQDFMFDQNLVTFCPEDWLGELSPWPANGLKKGEDFAGDGTKLLDWILNTLLPYLQGQVLNPCDVLLAGYSMAGLFALWAVCQTDRFAGVGSFSGSLWYDGWDEYARFHRPSGCPAVVLSLGDREPRAKDKRMAKVGDATKALLADWSFLQPQFWWEKGGHFADCELRIARGIEKLTQRWKVTKSF